jgi:ubiquinone/menaquinone biosynthesis C-methylase UbiE
VAGVVRGHGPGARVLDVGAGTGALTGQLHRLGFRCTALEPREWAVRQLGLALPGVAVVRGRAEQLPFGAGRFEVCTVAGAAPAAASAADLRSVLAELERVLVTGGDLVLLWNAPGGHDQHPWAAAVAASGKFDPLERRWFDEHGPSDEHRTALHRWRVPG